MNAIATIAGREIRDGLRNRWALGAVLLMAGLALTLAFLGSAPTGVVGASPLEVTVVGNNEKQGAAYFYTSDEIFANGFD